MFRLFMVLAIGAVPLYRAGLHGVAAVGYYITAMEYANVALGLGGRMEHIQAHLLMLMFSLQHDIGSESLYLVPTSPLLIPEVVGSKWDLSRVAMRICIENRYHRRPNRRLAPMEEQMQKRVFWACYISDRHNSSVLGRPVALLDEEINVEVRCILALYTYC